jgi:adhesin HecA-like repeat protein
MERMDRNIDLEGSDITVNSLTSDTGVTVTAGGLLVTAGGQIITAGNLVVTAGTTYLKGSIPLIKRQGAVATTDDGTAVVSAANMAAGIITCTPTAARSKATDSAGDICSGLTLGAQYDSADFTIVNLSTTDAHIITLTNGSGVQITGSALVYPREDTAGSARAGSATFRAIRSSADTSGVVIYRIA